MSNLSGHILNIIAKHHGNKPHGVHYEADVRLVEQCLAQSKSDLPTIEFIKETLSQHAFDLIRADGIIEGRGDTKRLHDMLDDAHNIIQQIHAHGYGKKEKKLLQTYIDIHFTEGG